MMGAPSITGLTHKQQDQFSTVLEVLAQDEHAPTAIREPTQAARVHIADSLAALELDSVRAAERIADIGSGVGFPGIALAVALPGAEVSLIESQRRSCAFLEKVCAAAEIENARVAWTRVEEWREGLSRYDVVVARALASQPVVLEYAAPLLRMGGTVVDWRGVRVQELEQEGDRAGLQLGLRRSEVRRVTPFPGAKDHHLHLFTKAHETPPRFPRRSGVARKRPLSG